MKTIKRVAISLVIACAVTLATMLVARAGGPYYISEDPLTRLSGSGALTTTSTSSCYGGSCKYMYQDAANPTAWRWEYTQANVYQWYVYRPYVGEAAAQYWWPTNRENWFVTVDQSANHGTWAYLGFSDYLPNSYGELRLGNQCVQYYWCGGLKVYWDDMKYTTSP
jgi:hypothetical protein